MTVSSTIWRYPDRPSNASAILQLQCSAIDNKPYGARKYLKRQNGVMSMVRSWLSSARGHWWYPFVESMTVKYLALLAAISATASADVGDWYRSLKTYRFNLDKSTHILILSVPFLGVTTMEAHHCVASVTGAMIPCSCNNSRSAFNFSPYAKGTV